MYTEYGIQKKPSDLTEQEIKDCCYIEIENFTNDDKPIWRIKSAFEEDEIIQTTKEGAFKELNHITERNLKLYKSTL